MQATLVVPQTHQYLQERKILRSRIQRRPVVKEPLTFSSSIQPFTWRRGQALPTQNEWSWTNLSSVPYVEQPVGTGFSQGTPTARNENDVAFLRNSCGAEVKEILSHRGKLLRVRQYAGMFVPWGGMQGFQTPIAQDSFIVDGVGALGRMHSERGLTYVEAELSGHM
ncbi:hypothetical protein BJV77DRAFT_963663 [Russula vinacea]|nr:hypothetical protein BJV77DRAFT_963663 [Russula vinacea]